VVQRKANLSRRLGDTRSREELKRFIAALEENPSLPLRIGGNSDVLISELAAGFLNGVESQIDKSHVTHFKLAVGYLVDIYGDMTVDEFSPKKLKTCRLQMVKAGKLCRRMVNDYTGRIKRIFAWGVEEELVPPNVYDAIRVVKILPKGSPGTFDHPERQEVPDNVVAATLPFLAPVVAAMVQVQWLRVRHQEGKSARQKDTALDTLPASQLRRHGD